MNIFTSENSTIYGMLESIYIVLRGLARLTVWGCCENWEDEGGGGESVVLPGKGCGLAPPPSILGALGERGRGRQASECTLNSDYITAQHVFSAINTGALAANKSYMYV